MTSCSRVGDALGAFHDGELSGLLRQRIERHLLHCAGCRRQLTSAQSLGEFLRRRAASVPSPDLWGAIAPRLTEIDAGLPVARPRTGWLEGLRALPGFARPLAALTAVAAAIALIALGIGSPRGTDAGVVRWLDSHGSPVILFEDPDSTIIWLLDPVLDEVSSVARVLRGRI